MVGDALLAVLESRDGEHLGGAGAAEDVELRALHIELEKAIAEFKGTEAAVCFTSAYSANASAVQTLLSKDDIVVSDQLNHASIIDAVRVSGVKNKFVYKHSDMGDLEQKLMAANELQKTPKSNGETPLILSAEAGDATTVRALLARGADPNAQSLTAWTALHGAAEAGSVECVELLVAAGASPDHGRAVQRGRRGLRRAAASLLGLGGRGRARIRVGAREEEVAVPGAA